MSALRGIETFVKAVEAGSIAGSARLLGISAAAASQNIQRLESALGVRLLTRTTRSLALTDDGADYYDRVKGLVRELELANQSVAARQKEPSGRLRVAATGAFARHVLSPILPEFSRRYPQLTVEVLATDRNVDHARESLDASIRIGAALEPGLVAQCIARVPSLFCASPDYLARAGRPATPEELSQHDCLVFRFPVNGRFLRWGFVRNGLHFDAPVRARMISDDIDVLARMAQAGAGITRLGAFIAEPMIARGELVELFAEEDVANGSEEARARIDPLEFFLCVRHRRELTPKVTALREYLQEKLPMEWRT